MIAATVTADALRVGAAAFSGGLVLGAVLLVVSLLASAGADRDDE